MVYSYRDLPSIGVVPRGSRLTVAWIRRTAMNDIGDGHNVEIPRVFGPVHLGFNGFQWSQSDSFSCVFVYVCLCSSIC